MPTSTQHVMQHQLQPETWCGPAVRLQQMENTALLIFSPAGQALLSHRKAEILCDAGTAPQSSANAFIEDCHFQQEHAEDTMAVQEGAVGSYVHI
jgi:hypothetical protein